MNDVEKFWQRKIEKSWQAKEYQQLQGGVIAQIIVDDSAKQIEYFGEPCAGFIVQMPDGTRKQVWVLSDTEGNGNGFLEIQNLKK